NPKAAGEHAKKILALETSLAQASRTKVELRDPQKNYNKMKTSALQLLTPDFKWDAYFKESNLPDPGELNVGQPDFFNGANKVSVADYFPPESKERMLELVNNLRSALAERIKTLEWMDNATKEAALKKLAAFTVKIGYPDKWRDYSALQIDRGPFVLNAIRASMFDVRRELAKIGKPVDRSEWGMTPPTVNAYYNPKLHEIVLPSG